MKHNWEYKKLAEVCNILNGYAFKSDKYTDKGIRIIRITNVQKGHVADDDPKFYPQEEICNISSYMLQEGDLLMSLTGNVGRVGLIKKEFLPAALNQRVACLRITKDYISLSYLYHLLNSNKFENEAINSSNGIAQKNMSTEWLKKYTIPLPPLPTQTAIVSELDTLSGIITECKETLKDYDALEQSIFYDMFGDPVKNDKGWEVKKVEDIGSCCSGGTPSRSHPEYFEGDIIWYSAGELNDLYLGESIEKITESALNNSSAKLCKAGSLFVGMYDTAAFKMGIATVDSCSNQACANVTLNDNNNVIWLYFTLLFMKEEALKNRHGARQKNLNLGYIKNFNIPVPPLSLQQEFASRIMAIEEMKRETKKALQEAETLFQARMDYWFG